eukprot:NODE_8420_length_410_cov_36.836565_g7546_i0.p2 GENE.NODE_8420_length_410_cov_36.836565_g7546_i0~~NODE_8420_length_410_cov_36.836565_g7546_i0.p2  ORF type:complete len:128 (+),score=31.19 NODE_8420_length_410_cov_36.836565_g7546_i0:24-386(+)
MGGHPGRRIDILKVDCEGCEWGSFLNIGQACKERRIRIERLLVELHGVDFALVSQFFDRMQDQCGLRITHKERNHWGCDGYLCVEFSFASPRVAFDIFVHARCPHLRRPMNLMYRRHALE